MPSAHASRRSGRQFRQNRLLLILAIVVGTTLLGIGGYRIQLSRQAPTLLERGRAAATEKSWQAAIDSFTQYLKLRPRDAGAHAELGDAFAATGRYRDAVQSYLEALAFDSSLADARRKLADIYHASGRWASSREQVLKLIGPTGKTTDPTLYLMLADCDFYDKKPYEERKNLQEAVALPGAPASASYRLADNLRTHDKTPQAIAAADAIMDALIAARSNDLDSRLLRSAYRKKYGDKPGAKADLEYAFQSISGAAENPVLIGEYVGLLRAEGDLVTAEKVLRASHAARPTDTNLTLTLASLLIEIGTPEKKKEGNDLIREVSTGLPDGDQRLLSLGDTLIDSGEKAAAQVAAARLASTPSGRLQAAYLTGKIALMDGDWPRARAELTQAIPALPKTAPENIVTAKAYLALASAHAAALDSTGQLEAARTALAISPGWASAKLVAADALLRQDKRSDAVELLRPIITSTPGARVMLARIRLADALMQPDAPNRWRDFEQAVGAPPYPAELALLVVHARVARNDKAALTELEDAIKKTPNSPQLWLGLITLKSDRDPAASLALVAKAEEALGDRADLRVARAGLLARDSRVLDPRSIVKLAADADKFPVEERLLLMRGLVDALVSRGFRAEALPLLKAAAVANPYDLLIRLQLFDLANAANDTAMSNYALDEIRRLDGATGPMTQVAEVSRALSTTPNPTPEQIARWRDQLTAAVAVRDGWSRPHALLGDLAKLEKKPDTALSHYQRALDRGGSGEQVIRATVELLMAQQKYDAAMRLMNQLDRSAGLPPALRKQFLLLRAASGEDASRALFLVRSQELAESPNYRDHLLRSFVFMLYGQPDEARGALNKALSINSTAPEVWEERVRFLSTVSPKDAPEQVNQATNALRKKGLEFSDPLSVPLTLGRCHELVGQLDKAEVEYKLALSLDRTDRRPAERLHDLYRRMGRGKEADALLESLIVQTGALGKWARRQLAFSRVEMPEDFSHMNDAIALIDRNLTDGNSAVEDIRAKAFILAVDPFKRRQALETLNTSLPDAPLTSVESLLLARLYLQTGQSAEAERLLIASTSGGPLALPAHLMLLARVQTERNDLAAARRTVDRLKLIDPFSWGTAVEQARLLAKTDKAAAAKALLSHRFAEKPETLLYPIAVTLEGLGCAADARKIYQNWYETEKRPDRHIPLTEFLIRQKYGNAALDLAFKHATDIPPGRTARLLSGAVQSRKIELVPAAEKDAWRKRVDEATKWVAEQASKDPMRPELLLARAELADAAGQYPDSMRLYGEAADRTEDKALKANLRNNRAWLLAVFGQDRSDEPLRLVNEAINARGPMPYFLDTRSMVRLAANQPEEALVDLEAILPSDTNGTYYFHRAIVLDRMNKMEARAEAVAEAAKRGLTRESIHPLEWPIYDRLFKK